MTWTIRAADATDADAWAAVLVQSWQEAYTHLLPDDFFTPEYAESRRQWWRGTLRDPPPGAVFRVGIRDERIVGIAMAGGATGALDKRNGAADLGDCARGTAHGILNNRGGTMLRDHARGAGLPKTA